MFVHHKHARFVDNETGTIGIWKIDGHMEYQSMMQFAVNRATLDQAAVALVVDMSRPWTIMSELEVRQGHQIISTYPCQFLGFH